MRDNFDANRPAVPDRAETAGSSNERRSFVQKLERFYAAAKRKAEVRFKPYGKYAFMAAFALSQQACAQYGMPTHGRFRLGDYPDQDRLQDTQDMGKPHEVKKRPAVERAIYGEKHFDDEWMWLGEGLYLPERAERVIQAERDAWAKAKQANPQANLEPTLRSLVRPVPQSADAVRPSVPEAIVRAHRQEVFDVMFARGLQPLTAVAQTGDGIRIDMRDVTSFGTPYWSAEPARGVYREPGASQTQIAEGDSLLRDYNERLAVGEAVSRLPPEQRNAIGLMPWQGVESRDTAALMRVTPGGRMPDTAFLRQTPLEWNLDRYADALVHTMLYERDLANGPTAARTAAKIELSNQIETQCYALIKFMAGNPSKDPTPLGAPLVIALQRADGFAVQALDLKMALSEPDLGERIKKTFKALKRIKEKTSSGTVMQPFGPNLFVGMSQETSKNYILRHALSVVVSGMDLPPGMALPTPAEFASLTDAQLRSAALAGRPDDGGFDRRMNEIKELKFQATQRALQAYQSAALMRLTAQIGEAKAQEYIKKASYLFGKSITVETFVKADNMGKGKVVVVVRINDPLIMVGPGRG